MTPQAAPSPQCRRRLLEEASRWFARTRASPFTATDRKGLEAWLDASPQNRQAYLEVLDLWRQSEEFGDEPELLHMREAVLRRYPAAAASRRARRTAVLLAGAGAAAALAVTALSLMGRQPQPQTFRTGVGQTATITLIDGSRVTLDTDTVLRTRMAARRREIHLDRGRAFFKVAKDQARPFVVEAAGRSVTATGTFEVTAEARRFEVLLVEGRVRVAQSSGDTTAARDKALSADLEPGTRLSSTDPRGWVLSRAANDELAWMTGELLFDNQSLADIAREMNRYSRRKIVISDPALAGRRVHGAFMAGDVDQFVHALVDYKGARIESESDGQVVLGPP